MIKLILASASPRRSDILRAAGIKFEVRPTDADESLPDDTPVPEAVTLISGRKCRAAAAAAERPAAGDDIYILAADTAVECFGERMGKPRDRDDARRMLTMLAGCGSAVHTGFTVMRLSDGRTADGCETTYVTFDGMTEREIEDYISTDEPYDKAGAYGIQGRAALYIPGITGDYFNVMGLPLHAVYATLRDTFGVTMTEFE